MDWRVSAMISQEILRTKSKEEELCSCLRNLLRGWCRRQLSLGSIGLQEKPSQGWRPLVDLENRNPSWLALGWGTLLDHQGHKIGWKGQQHTDKARDSKGGTGTPGFFSCPRNEMSPKSANKRLLTILPGVGGRL